MVRSATPGSGSDEDSYSAKQYSSNKRVKNKQSSMGWSQSRSSERYDDNAKGKIYDSCNRHRHRSSHSRSVSPPARLEHHSHANSRSRHPSSDKYHKNSHKPRLSRSRSPRNSGHLKRRSRSRERHHDSRYDSGRTSRLPRSQTRSRSKTRSHSPKYSDIVHERGHHHGNNKTVENGYESKRWERKHEGLGYHRHSQSLPNDDFMARRRMEREKIGVIGAPEVWVIAPSVPPPESDSETEDASKRSVSSNDDSSEGTT